MLRDIHDGGLLKTSQGFAISITDRCNFRCDYCMPPETFATEYEFLPRKQILSFEDIVMLVKAMLPLGLEKVELPAVNRYFERYCSLDFND